jgi:2-keto-4-pentenoate hydratase/2-oxohepta-3-ene-1,7-dioic acid hydratase in catechol pathway
MEKNTFIGELETLVQHEDALSVSREVNELKTRFEDYILEEERKEQVAQLEAQERGETYEPKDFKPLKEAFYDVYNVYKERRKGVIESKNAEESENLRRKKFLLNKLQDVIQNEENIGAAFGTYKEIHDEWKKIGNIPREKREEIQKEYSRLLELFFYNMKIYRELKDHDLKRNYQLKAEIVQQLEELKNVTSIKDLEVALKRLQNEWEEIGPVTNEDWEGLKNRYWETVRSLYEKVTHYYDERRTSLQENLNKKKELLQEVTAFVAESIAADSVKAWEDATEKLLKFQESWKAIGFGPRKENEEIWTSFRAQSDIFFEKKKAFFATIQDKFAVVADAKRKIIESAKALKESSEWKDTSEKLIRLQKEWKNVGHAGQKLEQKLWTEFRAACDSFFNARQKHFEEQDKALETNLLAKQEIIKNIEAYTPSEDKQKSLADLREFTNAFNAVGKVPMKEKDTVYHAYKSAIDQHYSKLKLEAGEKNRVMFEARLETLKGSPDAGKLLSKERFEIRQQIDKLKSDMLQYENNLGFFAKSKGADALRKEVESKINASKAKIEALIKKLKQIPNE